MELEVRQEVFHPGGTAEGENQAVLPSTEDGSDLVLLVIEVRLPSVASGAEKNEKKSKLCLVFHHTSIGSHFTTVLLELPVVILCVLRLH